MNPPRRALGPRGQSKFQRGNTFNPVKAMGLKKGAPTGKIQITAVEVVKSIATGLEQVTQAGGAGQEAIHTRHRIGRRSPNQRHAAKRRGHPRN